jgi:hypothetical protein
MAVAQILQASAQGDKIIGSVIEELGDNFKGAVVFRKNVGKIFIFERGMSLGVDKRCHGRVKIREMGMVYVAEKTVRDSPDGGEIKKMMRFLFCTGAHDVSLYKDAAAHGINDPAVFPVAPGCSRMFNA